MTTGGCSSQRVGNIRAVAWAAPTTRSRQGDAATPSWRETAGRQRPGEVSSCSSKRGALPGAALSAGTIFVMDPVLILGAAGAVVAIISKFVVVRFDRLISSERDSYETRISFEEDFAPELHAKLAELAQAQAVPPESDAADGIARQKMRALEIRLAELEVGQQSSQRDFAIQREYHALGLAQSKISFTLGYIFGALGSLVVLGGAIKALFFANTGSEVTAGVLTSVAGVIPEALSALLFVSASRAGVRAAENFDRGRVDRDLAAAQQIAAEMKDRGLGDRLQAVLALSLAHASIDDAALQLVQEIGRPSATLDPVDNRLEARAHGRESSTGESTATNQPMPADGDRAP
jgi:hypothetical protein